MGVSLVLLISFMAYFWLLACYISFVCRFSKVSASVFRAFFRLFKRTEFVDAFSEGTSVNSYCVCFLGKMSCQFSSAIACFNNVISLFRSC
jgi:hypothetical protein